MRKYKLSVITVVYNVSEAIVPTIESIKRIKTTNVEYVVIDGASTDDTMSVLNQYDDVIDVLVSEKDRGIYDAMNKGIAHSHGEWIIFQNCGDEMLSIPWRILENTTDDVAVVCGCVDDGTGKIMKPMYGKALYYGNTIPHQALFYRKAFNPDFDISFKIFADYDLNLKMLKRGYKIKLIEDVIAIHALDGISMDKKHDKEVYRVVYKELGTYRMLNLFLYWKWTGLIRILKNIC